MHVYQMRSSNQSVVSATEQRLKICMDALKEVSKVWLVAKMVHTLFESILGNKVLEERLQKAAGKRHKKNHQHQQPPAQSKPKHEASDPPKRKFDEMDIGLMSGPPAPQVSYERSRPQTPALTPSRDLPPQQQSVPQVASASPSVSRPNGDAFMGQAGQNPSSRSNTRPTTPFNPNYTIPGTPPDLFLITRNSPNLSQDLWQNFQPDQLFPADTSVSIPNISPIQQHSLVDPQLSQQPQPMTQPMQQPGMQGRQQPTPTQTQGQQPPPPPYQSGPSPVNGMGMPPHTGFTPQAETSGWPNPMDMPHQQGQGNEDTWSNSSKGGQGPIVPTTLNVEDW